MLIMTMAFRGICRVFWQRITRTSLEKQEAVVLNARFSSRVLEFKS